MVVRACKGNILLAVAGNCCLSSESQSVLGAGYLDPVNLPSSPLCTLPRTHLYGKGETGGVFGNYRLTFPSAAHLEAGEWEQHFENTNFEQLGFYEFLYKCFQVKSRTTYFL